MPVNSLASHLLVPDPSDGSAVMPFGSGNDGVVVWAHTFPNIGTVGNGWMVVQWLHQNSLNPSQFVTSNQSITDPTLGHPLYTFDVSDRSEQLNIYSEDGGKNFIYDLRQNGGQFNQAGVNLFLGSNIQNYANTATFDHQITLNLDAKLSEWVAAPAPGLSPHQMGIMVGSGFGLHFNPTSSSKYDASLPTYTVQFAIPLAQTPDEATILYPKTYGLTFGSGAPSLLNVSGEVIPGTQEFALQADGGTLHHLSYDINKYLEAMLEQSHWIDSNTGLQTSLPSALLDLSRWSMSANWIGSEVTNAYPSTLSGTASVGLTFANYQLSIDPNTHLTYSPPDLNGRVPTIISAAPGPVPTALAGSGTAPPQPIISDASGDSAALIVAGTGIAGDLIVVSVDGQALRSDGQGIGNTIVSSDGRWSVQLATRVASSGARQLSATEYDKFGSVSAASADYLVHLDADGNIDTVAPAAPTALAIAPSGNGYVRTHTPTISGRGTDGDTITVSTGAGVLGSTRVSGTNWSFTPAALADGTYSVSATETDPAGNTSGPSSTVGLVVDTVAPAAPTALAIAPSGNGYVRTHTPTISGRGTDGDTITVSTGAGVLGSTRVSGTNWSFTPAALADGTYSVSATETDPAGNTSGPSSTVGLVVDTVAPAAPTALAIAPSGNGYVRTHTPTISGRGTDGDTITVSTGAGVLGSTRVSGTNWSFTPAALADGTYSVSATETDPAGNTSGPSSTVGLVVDTVAPAAPTALAIAPSGNGYVRTHTPTISGRGTDGDTITVSTGAGVLGSTRVSGTNWSFTPAALADGTYSVSATETDPAGNTSGPSSTVGLVVDTVAPAAPTALAIAPSGNGYVRTHTPTISGRGTDGDTITVSTGAGVLGSTRVSGTNWSFTPAALADGTYSVSATETDPAGNTSGPSSTVGLVVDTVAPAAPTALAIAPSGNGYVRTHTPTISGRGTDGDTITVSTGAGVLGSTRVSGTNWSFTPAALADGTYSVSATETDPAGNTSGPSSTVGLVVDTVAPAAPTLAVTNSTALGKLTLAGSTAPRTAVTVSDDGLIIGTATADGAGNWTLALATIPPSGTHILLGFAIDDAGNTSTSSKPLFLQTGLGPGYITAQTRDDGETVKVGYDQSGHISTMQLYRNDNLLLQSVTNDQSTINIYDADGTLLGNVYQPTGSVLALPDGDTSGQAQGAITAVGATESTVSLFRGGNTVYLQGNSTVTAGMGDDTIFAGGSATLVHGGSGSLLLVGGHGTLSVTGGSGSSTVFGGSNGGSIEGGSAGQNLLVAGDGNTTLVGGGQNDTLAGGSGTTIMTLREGGVGFGSAGHSTIVGSDRCVMVGGSGVNVMIAGAGTEALWGGSGENQLYGGAGDDTLVGGQSGSTTVLGGRGNDIIIGSGGRTFAQGGTGNDLFFSGSGDMTAVGGQGANTFVFGTGNSTVTGGGGTSLYFVVAGHVGGEDIINNFAVGRDQIQLFGYGADDVQLHSGTDSTTIGLSDGTRLTLTGVIQLASDSIGGWR